MKQYLVQCKNTQHFWYILNKTKPKTIKSYHRKKEKTKKGRRYKFCGTVHWSKYGFRNNHSKSGGHLCVFFSTPLTLKSCTVEMGNVLSESHFGLGYSNALVFLYRRTLRSYHDCYLLEFVKGQYGRFFWWNHTGRETVYVVININLVIKIVQRCWPVFVLLLHLMDRHITIRRYMKTYTSQHNGVMRVLRFWSSPKSAFNVWLIEWCSKKLFKTCKRR